MASKSVYQASEKGAEIVEQLDSLEALLERLRATYEQYFLGILKIAPSQLHLDAERRVREITQIQIKNTALRYRFATLSQKFGAYNMYWKRTMRMIEQGRYVRDLQRVQRQASRNGAAIPDEILAAMPKRMRDRVARDRAAQLAIAERQNKLGPTTAPQAEQSSDDGMSTSTERGHTRPNVHRLDDAMPDDFSIDDMFAALTRDAEAALDEAPRIVHQPRPKPMTEPPPVGTSRRKPPTTVPPMRPPSAMRSAGVPPPLPRRAPPPVTTTPPPPVRVAAPTPPMPMPAVTRPPATPSAAAPSKPPRPAPPPGARPGGPATRTPAPPPPPGMDDASTRALYDRYLKARELCGESNDGVTYDKLVRTLRSQSSRIMTDTRANGVEFAVVIKDNKVVLKAKPKL